MQHQNNRGLLLIAALSVAWLFHPDLARGTLRTVLNLNNSGAGSLRQAILDSGAGDSIAFTNGLTGTITLTTGTLKHRHLDDD